MTDIVVLNYNDWQTTKKFINSVIEYKSTGHIIVVDNCSTDDSFTELVKSFQNSSKVDVIKTEMNGGYGSGNNFGVHYAKGKYGSKYVVICNPDVTFEEHTIISLHAFLLNNQDYGIVAPFMKNADGIKQTGTAWKIPTKWQYIMSLGMLYSKFFSKIEYDRVQLWNEEHVDVDVVSGACLMINVDHFCNSGMYDEKIFLYCEEVTLSIRMKEHNYKVALLPNYDFIHCHSVSISKTYKGDVQKRKLLNKSKIYVLKNYYGTKGFSLLIAKMVSKISILECFLNFKLKERKTICHLS